MIDRHDITAALRRSGSSQAAIGRRLHLTRGAINNVVSGRSHNAQVERTIARVLGISVTAVRASLRRRATTQGDQP